MKAVLSGREFGRQVAFRFGIFLALAVGVPLALYGIDRASGSDVRLDEAVALVTATPVGLLLFFILVLSLIRPSWRRMKALGLPGWSGLFAPWLLLADNTYLITTEHGWGFSSSTLDGRIPFYAITALGFVAAMVFAQPAASSEGGFRRFGVVGKIALVLAAILCGRVVFDVAVSRWLHVVLQHDEDAPPAIFMFLMKASIWEFKFAPYIFFLFFVLLAWCTIDSRRNDGRPMRFGSS